MRILINGSHLFLTALALLSWGATVSAAPLKGSYSVPVQTRLARYATFDVEGQVLSNRLNQRIFSYDLPEDLIGRAHEEILLKQTGEQNGMPVFDGKIASAACIPELGNKLLMCFVHYHSLRMDISTTEQFLRNKYGATDGALQGRVDVARAFTETPGGVIRLPNVP